ncbi:MAG: hypothetical protein LBG21_00175 [Campylobacteraceae bacterium]|nr:hypothetical protein [Campylobacteraceae bacterium]
MKKTVILSIALILSFGGCGNKKDSNTDISKNITNPPVITPTPEYSCEGGDTVNGFTLPACPDQKLNDSTLLGIDANDNGVRDDVERWLIIRYKDHHKIVTEIGFQADRARRFMFVNPDKPEEARQLINGAQSCNSYFEHYADLYNEPILIDHDIITSTAYKTIQLNTEQRIKAYLDYDRKLSGGVYKLPHIDEKKAFCDFDVDALLKETR